jgi:peptidase, M16 family
MKQNSMMYRLKDKIFHKKLSNNMDLFFMKKEGFTKKYAVFATDFGSNNLSFVSPHTGEEVTVNEGIAHFLEHKMFEQPNGTDAFERFSEIGADANAFTNFDMTAYLFSSTDFFYDGLKHLISYVQTPYFTKENVEKEKEIIAQEIKMYQDNPEWVLFFNALKAMYINHNNRIDIAGTVESIYRITPEELYTCYNTFYSPSNMALFVIGDLDWNDIVSVVENTVKNDLAFEGGVHRLKKEEPNRVNQKTIVEDFPISIPMFMIAFKEKMDGELRGKDLMKKIISTEIILDLLFRKGSGLNEELYNENLIFSTLDCEYNASRDYGYTLISAESRKETTVIQKIMDCIANAKKLGLNQEDFDRVKKSRIGSYIKSFDAMEGFANNYVAYYFQGMDWFEYGEILEGITLEFCQDRLEKHFVEDMKVVSFINPK